MKKLIILLLLIPFAAKAQTIQVGGNPSSPITLTSNTNYSFLTIDGANAKVNLVTGTNISNVHIHKLYLRNTKGFAILLNNCHNIEIDSTYFNNIGFGVYAQSGSTQINVHGNQFLNVNGIDSRSLGHAVQFNAVTGSGNRINFNRVENVKNITDTSSHPHDQLSLFQCNGIVGDSIQVNYNWIRGGQLVAWPTSGSTGDGIGLSDVGGNYQVARGNIEVNPGCAGIQVIANGLGGGIGIKAEGNVIYSKQTPVSANGINVQNPIQMAVYSNRTNWTNFRGLNVLLPDGETQYDYFSSPTPTGQTTNKWQDASVTANILPPVIITMVEAGNTAPSISYTTPNVFTIGQSVSLSPNNTGGTPTSYSISGVLPPTLSFNTSTGAIAGTATATAVLTSYTVTATNASGSGKAVLSITIVPVPVSVPIISYQTPQTYTAGVAITSLVPTSTGGAVVSYNAALPTGLSIAPLTGLISGTPSVVTSATNYTVNAVNASGTGHAVINITVNPPAVSAPNVHYSPSVQACTYGGTVTVMTPVNTGGTFTSSSIAPTLPSGLNFQNGVISGVPTIVHSQQTYVVTFTNTGGSDTAHVTLTINAAPLMITALSYQRLYNTANPTFAVAYTGLKNNDTAPSTPPTVSTTATMSSPPGIYALVPSGASDARYIISYVSGLLSIYQVAQVVGVSLRWN